MIDKVEQNYDQKYLRLQVLDRMKTLKEELEDMETIVKEDLQSSDTNDTDLVNLNNRIKELEKQIVRIVEGWEVGELFKNYLKQNKIETKERKITTKSTILLDNLKKILYNTNRHN